MDNIGKFVTSISTSHSRQLAAAISSAIDQITDGNLSVFGDICVAKDTDNLDLILYIFPVVAKSSEYLPKFDSLVQALCPLCVNYGETLVGH